MFGLIFATAGLAQTWDDVGSIFAGRCTKCHSGPAAPLGLDLSTYDSAISGSWTGRVIVAGDAANSPVIRRLKGEILPRMPFDGPPFLTDEEIALISAWIDAGAIDGESKAGPISLPEVPRPGEPVNFAHVERIFLQRCVKCHSDNSVLGSPPEGLRLGSYGQILVGAERLVLVPGNPEMSEIWRKITGISSPRMPKDGPPYLSEDEIRLIRDWISQGAADANGEPAPIPAGREIRLRGILTARNAIDGAVFTVTPGTRIDKPPAVGDEAEVRAIIADDGSVRATRLRSR